MPLALSFEELLCVLLSGYIPYQRLLYLQGYSIFLSAAFFVCLDLAFLLLVNFFAENLFVESAQVICFADSAKRYLFSGWSVWQRVLAQVAGGEV